MLVITADDMLRKGLHFDAKCQQRTYPVEDNLRHFNALYDPILLSMQ
jgi:hypothetical protein